MTALRGARPVAAGTSRWCRPAGFSVTELLVAVGVAAILAAMSSPPLAAGRDAFRAAAAGRYLASILHAARMNAVQRGQAVGVRFDRNDSGYGWAIYADGNSNGVRSADISSGADPLMTARSTMPEVIPGVEVGAAAGVPQLDSAVAIGDDPVRLGSSDILSFSPDGSSSSGTVYLVGHGGHSWAVRVLGATARIRLSRFDTVSRQWVAP